MAEGPVTFLLNKLSSLLENEIQLCSNIQQEVIHVRDELARIKAFLRTADSLTECDDEVKSWVKQIRDHAYCIEDVLDEFRLVSEHQLEYGHQGLLSKVSGNIKSMKARYRVASEFRRISSGIKSVCEGNKRLRQKFKRAGQLKQSSDAEFLLHDQRENALLLDTADLVGIEDPKKQIVQWLIEGPVDREVVSVVGMGGLGKTTLVKQVFDDPAVKKIFAVRIWLILSPSAQIEELLQDMLQQVATQIRKSTPRRATDTPNLDWLKMIMKSMLLNKRYLILLDDIWHVDRWDSVKYAFPNDKNGSRLMLTTRNTDVASASRADFGGKIYELLPLSEEESWKLFCRKAFEGNSCPPTLEKISKCILKKCEGLPLPIVAMSGVLASKDTQRVDEWDLVRRSLHAEIDRNGRLQKINKVLSLSFYDLPHYLKSCFLHLSVFPEGHAIECMRLIRLWVAEGFTETKEGRTLEEVAEGYINELLNRSLLRVVKTATDGRVKLCRAHHLLQQIAIRKSIEQNFVARVDEESPELPDNVRRLSIHGKFQTSAQNRSFVRLRSLYTSDVDKQSAQAAVQYAPKLLSVLDLRASPIQVFEMYALRYLSFRCSKVKTVPRAIGDLRNLETLDLKHTYVTELPTEIEKLRRLRHLLVYRYETISYSDIKYGFKTLADIGCLQDLQKLCYVDASNERSPLIMRDIGKLTQLRRLSILKLKKEDGFILCSSITRLTNLCSLRVYGLDDDEILDLQDLVSPPPLLQRIYLRGRLLALPKWIPTCTSLIKACLRWCHLMDDPLPSLQNLPNLAHLELQDVYDWKMLHFTAKGFKKLERLGLNNFHKLRGIQVEEGAMPCLVQLTIRRCKLLQNVPLGIEHLTKLRALEFFDVHDELVRKVKLNDQSGEYWRVAHIPELRYGSWTDGGWEVKSVERQGNKAGSSHTKDCRSRSDLPPW